ncbi:MAG: hypothetical protein LBF42_00190 [Puniceicoccales bacterium]|jgi:hypothetical protein|nr:hypothetical protein [Puniceicoccales bacterium]
MDHVSGSSASYSISSKSKLANFGKISMFLLKSANLLTIACPNKIVTKSLSLAFSVTKLVSTSLETGGVFLAKQGKLSTDETEKFFFSLSVLLKTIDAAIKLLFELLPYIMAGLNVGTVKESIGTILSILRVFSAVYDVVVNLHALPREKLFLNIAKECANALAKLAIIGALLSFNAVVKNWVIVGIMVAFLVQNWKSNEEYKFIHSAVEEFYLFKTFPKLIQHKFSSKPILSTASVDKG